MTAAVITAACAACTGHGHSPVDGDVVASASACGFATHEENGACVGDTATRYTIRAPSRIVADGKTPSEIAVFGTHADGSPALDELVFNTDRSNAGTFMPAFLTMDERGGKAAFVPCSSSTPGCLGPLQVTAALASAPSTPVARFAVELFAPPAVGSAEHCPAGANILYLDGSGFVYDGKLTVYDATFTATGGNERINLQIAPTHTIQGAMYSLEFDTVQLGTPMVAGVYQNAYQGSPVGGPGIAVAGSGTTCNVSYQGEFQVFDYAYASSLQHVTISFREWCPDNPSQVISGCVHVE